MSEHHPRMRHRESGRNVSPPPSARNARVGGSAQWCAGMEPIVWLASVLTLVLSCGQVDPPVVVPSTGSIAVTSTPESADIFLDGRFTGLVTPDTVDQVAPGPHWVRVALPGFVSSPCSLQVLVQAGVVSSVHFDLAPVQARPVLLESFTNTGCAPCAQANPMLYALVAQEGPSRVVLMEFHPSFPSPLDPFYLAQRGLMDARVALYGVVQAPWVVVEGVEAFPPVSAEEVRAALSRAAPSNAVTLMLRARVQGTALACSLGARTTSPGRYVVTVFVTDDLEEFETAPGSNGEKEFRHVVRGVIPLPCGEEVDLSGEVVWRTWDTTVPWREEGESLTLVAHARRPTGTRVEGLLVLPVSAQAASLRR